MNRFLSPITTYVFVGIVATRVSPASGVQFAGPLRAAKVAAANGPTRSRLAGRFLLREHRNGERIFVSSPGRTALAVYQPSIPRPAKPTRRSREPIRSSGYSSGDSQYRLGGVTFDVRSRSFAFDADY